MSRFSNTKEVSSVHQSRIAVFEASTRPSVVSDFTMKNSRGSCTVTGRLGQGHQNFLDAAFLLHERANVTDDSRVHLLLDPYRIRMFLGISKCTLDLITKDLFEAKLKLTVEKRDIQIIDGRILDETRRSISKELLKANPLIATKGMRATKNGTTSHVDQPATRNMLAITISRSWSRFMADDIRVYYSASQLSTIVNMRFGISQALARWCLSHQNVNEPLPQVLGYLRWSGRAREKIRQIEHDAAELKKLGINFDQDYVKYRKGRQQQDKD